MVLQDGLIVVNDGQIVTGIDEELVGKTRVVNIVYSATQNGSHDLQGGEALSKGVAGEEEVSGLGDVSSVEVVVVADRLLTENVKSEI